MIARQDIDRLHKLCKKCGQVYIINPETIKYHKSCKTREKKC